MKTKHFLITAFLALTSVAGFSQVPPQPGNDPLPFGITGPGDDNIPIVGNPLPKSPIQIPEVYLDGHTLSFDAAIEGCEVRLLDSNENVVFADSIEENQTTLVLPNALTGTFELQIIRGDIIFYCIIELE